MNENLFHVILRGKKLLWRIHGRRSYFCDSDILSRETGWRFFHGGAAVSQGIYQLITPLLAVIAHFVAFLQFQLSSGNSIPLPWRWGRQFDILLSISLVLSLLAPFCRRFPMAVWSMLFFRGLIIIIIGLPMGGCLGAPLTLLIAWIVEIFEYTSLWPGFFFSFGLLGYLMFMQSFPVNAWGAVLPVATRYDKLTFGVYAGMAIIFNLLIRFLRNNQMLAAEVKRSFQEATRHLAQVNMQLQEFAVTAKQEAVLEERKRFARDIHDTLAYTLTNLVMMVEAAKYLVNPAETELVKQLGLTHQQASEGLNEVHRALQALRPTQLSQATGMAAIYQLVTTFAKATQIEVKLNMGNAPLAFGEEADLAVYHLVQEGITNALRHGRATEISISFSLMEKMLHILIQDNGIGAKNTHEGFGLTGMRERIEKLGGRLETAGGVATGFRLLGVIPIQNGVAHGKD